MKTYSRLTLAFLLLILVVPQVGADEPPGGRRLIRHWPNGKKMVDISILNGEQHGPATSWYKNGLKMNEGQYNRGKKDGRWIGWFEDGSRIYEVHFKNGVFDGPAVTGGNLDAGMKEAQGNYKNGKKVGLWTMYHVFTKNNPKKYETHWKNGKKDGLMTEWDKDGNKIEEVLYKDGGIISRKEF